MKKSFFASISFVLVTAVAHANDFNNAEMDECNDGTASSTAASSSTAKEEDKSAKKPDNILENPTGASTAQSKQ